ncbi:redox-regulated ATPase YchF [Georgenia halophila]|uniref:Ribosome-binding ATPase YchF n=1 Tax=Georgenia halophila TaxID=620889 RepID=A0ABP8L599_9MICO
MALTIGIVGLPNVGKSTLFNALTRATVVAENYPFATIEPNVGVVPLPDPRLGTLTEMFDAEKTIPATVSFVDIAGIVKGASEGEGLGNQFLANIREADAICQVTRAFADPDVVHVNGAVDPKDDIETVATELVLADLQTLEKAIPRLEKEVRGKKTEPQVLETAKGALAVLEQGTLLTVGAKKAGLDPEIVASFQLMTSKPFIYVFNVDDAGLADETMQAELRELVAPAEAIFLDAKFESELVELEPDEAAEMLAESGQPESGLDQLATVGFRTLGLQTFLTAGPKEARAWTIGQGWTAPQAAGVIHTDFQKGFIKAEIISFDDLVELGSIQEARGKGKMRMEGKDYVMRDGDVVEFRSGLTAGGKK